jgi:hypothetical protein
MAIMTSTAHRTVIAVALTAAIAVQAPRVALANAPAPPPAPVSLVLVEPAELPVEAAIAPAPIDDPSIIPAARRTGLVKVAVVLLALLGLVVLVALGIVAFAIWDLTGGDPGF